MPKSNDRGGGPGTYTSGGVRCTLDAPWKNGANKGSQENMGKPFNAGRSGGDNTLPTYIYDDLGGKAKAPAVNSVSSAGTILTNPKGPRR